MVKSRQLIVSPVRLDNVLKAIINMITLCFSLQTFILSATTVGDGATGNPCAPPQGKSHETRVTLLCYMKIIHDKNIESRPAGFSKLKLHLYVHG